MSWQIEKSTGDIVIYDYDKGVMPSPHKGLGNIQNANLQTEAGEAMASYGRVQNTATSTTSASGVLNFVDGSHVGLGNGISNNLYKGNWIQVSSSTHTGELPNGVYYVINQAGPNFQLATSYIGATITGFTSGLTASFALFRTMSKGVAYATETYFVGPSTFYRYYVLDDQGLVWMYDSINDVDPTTNQQFWVLPDNSTSYFGSDTAPSGIAVLNGWLLVFSGNKIWVKPTVNLSSSYSQMTNAVLMSLSGTGNPHFAYVGHQGRCYYTDGNFVGSIFPDTSIEVSGLPNIQSYASYTATTTTSIISQLIAGSIPSDGNPTSVRVPVVFFPTTGGTLPSAVTANTVYYLAYSIGSSNFQAFAAATGGSALDLQTGASGIQYYNTFYPLGTHSGSGGDHATMVFTPQRLVLPNFETSQCLTEIGNLIIVGARTNTLYPWNQIDATPGSIIPLPENDTKQLLTVNQMAYVFTGYKGNVYITDGNVASLVIKVPDYCAGVPGTLETYFEPVYTWGGVAYIRGRVYFSILDQRIATNTTFAKSGNCGGIWSFIPTQNLYIGQDTGLALRLENQNSYGTYNGYATLIINNFNQQIKSPQFFSSWVSSLTSPAYGIDQTQVHPVGSLVIESDLIPVGTVLNKYTPKQIEYKLASPKTSTETVTLAWRKNATDAWTSAGNVILPDGATSIAGYFQNNFQGAQWVQLQLTLTADNTPVSSYMRLSDWRIRN